MKCAISEICGDWALEVFAGNTVCDMVEVVRCKDCKYLMFSDFYGECGRGYMGIVRPCDYCSRGERKKVLSPSGKD